MSDEEASTRQRNDWTSIISAVFAGVVTAPIWINIARLWWWCLMDAIWSAR